jgi:lipopolysaccharide export system protein LptA
MLRPYTIFPASELLHPGRVPRMATRTRDSRRTGPARSSVVAVSLLVAGLLSGAYSALAEKADRSKPLHIEADKVTLDDAAKVSVFEGHVVMTQGTTRITADKVTLREDKDGNRYASLLGDPVTYREKRDNVDEYIEGYGQRAELDGKDSQIELFTRAELKRNDDELHGDYIFYNSKTELFKVVGGGSQAATPDNPQGRVRATIQPKPKAGAAGPPPGPPLPLKSDKGTSRVLKGSNG